MSDFESRLRDTLTERSTSAPEASGLADGARRRLRRRRTSWTVAAAAALAVVAVPVAIGLGGDERAPDDGAPVATEPPAAADGFRHETWRDLTLEVPDDWGHGGSDWCVFDGTLETVEPRVARPDTISHMILCTPANNYGVTIGSNPMLDPAHESGTVWRYDTEEVAEAQYPDDTWLSYWYDGSDVVVVATPDRELTTRIVDSVTRFEGLDPNGCPRTLGEAEAMTSTDRALMLCRYGEEDLLAASGSWTGDEAAARWATLVEAPLAERDASCAQASFTSRIAILDADGYRASAITDGCRKGIGIYFSGATRELTQEASQVLRSIG